MDESKDMVRSISQDVGKMLNMVANYQPEDMKMIFAKLEALKATLEAADMFHEASIQYAQLEAYALIRAVELSDGKMPMLTGRNKYNRAKAAVWLFNMTEQERLSIIEQCKDGKTILAIYKEITAPTDKEIAKKIRKRICKEMFGDLALNGVCCLNRVDNLFSKIPNPLKNDVKDGIRNELLKKGAVGLGDSNGTYIIPNSQSDEVYKALQTRLRSIQHDYLSFLSIAKECDVKPHFRITDNPIKYVGIYEMVLILAGFGEAIELSCFPNTKYLVKNYLNKINEFVQAL